MKVDLAIIGGGGAAFAAASKAAELGARAVLLNKGLPLGGTCVNVGCVPSKTLLEAGLDRQRMLRPRFKAVSPCESAFDFAEAIAEKEETVQANRKAKYIEVLSGYKNVELIEERGRFDGPGRIRADNRLIEAEHVLVATGSSNKPLRVQGIETLRPGVVLDNSAAFSLKELPKSMIVVGAGPTGLEVAQMFARFGTRIVCVEALDRAFTVAEPEISEAIQEAFRDDGIELCSKMTAKSVRQDGGEVVLTGDVAGSQREFRAEKLFVAVGVKGNTEDLNLGSIGLKPDKNGFLDVDERFQTRAAGVFAAGDVVGPPWLETLAAREGALAAENALEGKRLSIDYDAVPAAVFIEPQVAVVGLTEREVIKRFGRCDCRTVELSLVPKASLTRQTRGVAKMTVHPDERKILGFQLVCPNAAEIIHEAALAIQFGAKVDDLIRLVHVFPTFGEIVKITAQAFKRDVRHMSCCVE